MNEKEMRQLLSKEVPVLKNEIYTEFALLDKKTRLHASDLEVEFTYDEKTLGAYVPKHMDQEEHFEFSLIFLGFAMNGQITKEERIQLYKHEYAHYMSHYISIPKDIAFKAGVHGSDFIYCCSLIGANPDEGFTPGQATGAIDYEKLLAKKKETDHNTVKLLDQNQQKKEYMAQKNRQVKFNVGDAIKHPKFGQGTIAAIEQLDGSVRLIVDFPSGQKSIDQAWLLKTAYKRAGDR